MHVDCAAPAHAPTSVATLCWSTSSHLRTHPTLCTLLLSRTTCHPSYHTAAFARPPSQQTCPRFCLPPRFPHCDHSGTPPPLLPSPHSAALPHMLRMLSYFPYCTGLSGAAKAPGSQPQPPPCTLFSLGTLIMCILLSVTPGADTGLAHCDWSRIGHR